MGFINVQMEAVEGLDGDGGLGALTLLAHATPLLAAECVTYYALCIGIVFLQIK